MNRETLIHRLKHLIRMNEMKQKEYQEKNNFDKECGCITKEAIEMVSLLPEMRRLNVTFDDCLKMD